MWRQLKNRLGFHPRAWWDALLTYPRFLGRIKPQLLGGLEEEVRCRLDAFQGRWEVARLQAPVGKKLLVIAPHPDDEAIGPGGLLLAHRGLAKLFLLNVFEGRGGGRLPEEAVTSGSTLTAWRSRELDESAKRLGCVSVERLNFEDGLKAPTEAHLDRFRKAVLAVKPDVIILPWFLDGQDDHRMVNTLLAGTCAHLPCLVLAYEIWSLLQPNAVFDTTALLEEKVSLVSLYRSQTAEIDYPEYVRSLAKMRGFQHGGGRAGAVEAYFALPCADYCAIVQSMRSPTAKGQPRLRAVAGGGA